MDSRATKGSSFSLLCFTCKIFYISHFQIHFVTKPQFYFYNYIYCLCSVSSKSVCLTCEVILLQLCNKFIIFYIHCMITFSIDGCMLPQHCQVPNQWPTGHSRTGSALLLVHFVCIQFQIAVTFHKCYLFSILNIFGSKL
jgi:hypothetical protein